MPTGSQIAGAMILMILPYWAFVTIVRPGMRVQKIKRYLHFKDACSKTGISPKDIRFSLEETVKTQHGFMGYRFRYEVTTKAKDGTYVWRSNTQMMREDSTEHERAEFLEALESIAKGRKSR
jgi:hypothetical protein